MGLPCLLLGLLLPGVAASLRADTDSLQLPQMSRTPGSPACNTSATCVRLSNPTCMGQQLPYNYTYLELATDSTTELEVHEKLRLWSGLQNVPKCWEVIQPLLCAVYLPRCDPVTETVELPSRELCQITRSPCKIVTSVQPWPTFLLCNHSHFVPGCKNQVRTVRFNTTGQCMAPLVPTDNRKSWYLDVEGCGIQCANPLFTPDEHRYVHATIAVSAALCLAATLFAILTFAVDWQNANRYPALILFFINICFFVGSVGWVLQFIPGMRQDITCRKDGTVRQAEPQIGSGETVACSIVFVLVYFSMMAGVTWFLVLSYTWHLTFRALGSPQDAIEGKKGTFHLVAWSVPLVLTIVCLALTQVDGDSVSGICFVGYLNHEYRGGFVLLPISTVVAGGLFFLTRGLVTLIKIKLETPGLISDRASAKIRDSIIRIGLFTGLAFLLMLSTCLVHVYIFINEPAWRRAFQDFVICETNRTVARLVSNETSAGCVLHERPSLVAMIVHILLFFVAGITMSSWVWTAATLKAWRRFFRRLFNMPSNETIKLKKHLMIRQAFNKRHDIHRHGRFEFSFHSTHDDPLGMKMDLNSATSQELSSAWAQAIPRMISRRGAFAKPSRSKRTAPRRYSDSDVHSFHASAQETSVETRRYSVESDQNRTEVEDLQQPRKHKPRKRRGKNRVSPLVTMPPLASTAHPPQAGRDRTGPLTTGFLRRHNRVGVSLSPASSGGGGRRGSVSGSEVSEPVVQHVWGEPADSSDTGSYQRSKRGSLTSVELPAVTLPPGPLYHHHHSHSFQQVSVLSANPHGLPGAVSSAYEMSELVVDMEPTFTSVTPIDTELQSTPPPPRRRVPTGGGRRASGGSARSASSGHGRTKGRGPVRRFVVHTPKAAINAVRAPDSDECSEISA